MTGAELPAISAAMRWQSDTWQRLLEQLDSGHLPHALLVTGPAETGKDHLAMALARLLLCHAPKAGHNCGECAACRYSQSGAHGDFRWLAPEGKSRVIKIDQVRELVAFAFRTAGFGQRKVVVVSPADCMNVSAANALLKCLEEPARDTHIILVCERLHAVPATVRSRCQLLKLPLPRADDSLAWLDQLTGDRQQSTRLLSLAAQRPLRAERLYRESRVDVLEARQVALQALVEGRAQVPAIVAVFAELPLVAALDELTDYLQAWLRGQEVQRLRGQGRQLFRILDRIRALQGAAGAGSNPNPQLVLESLLLDIHSAFGGDSDGATMAASSGEARS
ncbi:DNA polymerase III subunit delta' [Kineobactrum salinum]|uniref:DNA-directed DNA polymerase n=1 Tax=Kineobactrum salinum TaxID=2708301 RepID=A0A6C0U8M5_9GAMM|nr:DNA polymerase III subunit delta' [Kineobactrum salinum]QIB67417.1 DNA polymerase III subunit delta' [Kineobactrum salinum]